MASLNKMLLIGNLTKDPELKYIPSGKAVCTLRVAATERFKTATGEARESTLFVDVVVWGRSAENCSTYLKKGRPVFVEGRLEIREFDGRDGTKRKATQITASRVQFLGGREGGGREDAPPAEAGGGGEAAEEPLPSFDEEA